ncbi:MAG: twin-arginine translocase TatA/TatE family subunit [Acidobacteria bacterium]|nr:MAG: twin-arginine translocase TatA/TatE family subunit [Acidobacteriota bacterium]
MVALGVHPMGSIGVPELILIFVILLLIFGGKKIPELARGLGAGIRNFRDAMHEGEQGDPKNKDPKGN